MRYFAYGANMPTLRMHKFAPGAEAVGKAVLPGYVLRWNKKSIDGSGKCTIHFTGEVMDEVWGVIYELNENYFPAMDRNEGPGYERVRTMAFLNGEQVPVQTYIAKPDHLDDALLPYKEYKHLVLAGAVEHDLPRHYALWLWEKECMERSGDDSTG